MISKEFLIVLSYRILFQEAKRELLTAVLRGVFPIEVEPLSEEDAGEDGTKCYFYCTSRQSFLLIHLSFTDMLSRAAILCCACLVVFLIDLTCVFVTARLCGCCQD